MSRLPQVSELPSVRCTFRFWELFCYNLSVRKEKQGVIWALIFMLPQVFIWGRLFGFYHQKIPMPWAKLCFVLYLLCGALGLVCLSVSQDLSLLWACLYAFFETGLLVWLWWYDVKLHRQQSDIPLWWRNLGILNVLFVVMALTVLVLLGEYAFAFPTGMAIELVFVVLTIFVVYDRQARKQRKLWRPEHRGGSLLVALFGTLCSWFYNLIFLWGCCSLLYIYLLDVQGNGVDSCITTGWCKEGNFFDSCPENGGKPCVITSEYCREHNFVWHEKLRVCDTRHYNSAP